MSRRSHRSRHGHRGGQRPPSSHGQARLGPPPGSSTGPPEQLAPAAAPEPVSVAAPPAAEAAPRVVAAIEPPADAPADDGRGHDAPVAAPAPTNGSPQATRESDGCTAPQLRRFIKSRAYVPMHELRRRFELNGAEDEVHPVVVDGRRLYVGLPRREAGLLAELLGAGDVGYELLLDPTSPLIVGLYPMRPVPRS
jgi:hypothetical protein